MISLIVCSVNPKYLTGLRESVSATIGIEHEWLIWDNRQDNIGLAEVYNKMAEKSTFPYLLFLHEDLLFTTPAWGQYLVNLFTTTNALLIGVAGSDYKSKTFSGWYTGGGGSDYANIQHSDSKGTYRLKIPTVWDKPEAEVVTVDGVFMACTRQAWDEVKFDQETLKGFHFYDIDFSTRVARYGKVLVTSCIDMVHLTVGGDFGDRWVTEAFKFHDKVGATLPLSCGPARSPKAERPVVKYWLDWLKSQRISFRNRLHWISKQRLWQYPFYWYGILKFLLYNPLGLRRLHNILKKK